MPRRKKGARLWLRQERRDKRGRITQQASWFIIDNGRHVGTGCTATETAEAERKLAAYIAEKHQPIRRERDIESIPVADVLWIYLEARADSVSNVKQFEERINRLNEFFGHLMLADINADLCREYGRVRGNRGGARRDLEDLRAAINLHTKEGLHRGVVHVVLPQKGLPRDRWLTRKEVADLLWVCWRTREVQTVHRGSSKGQAVTTAKYPLRHLARFILLGIYTGTRAGAIATASPARAEGRSFVDLDQGLFYRLAEGRQATNKRQPPVPIPPRLLAHVRRWVSQGIVQNYIVEWNGHTDSG